MLDYTKNSSQCTMFVLCKLIPTNSSQCIMSVLFKFIPINSSQCAMFVRSTANHTSVLLTIFWSVFYFYITISWNSSIFISSVAGQSFMMSGLSSIGKPTISGHCFMFIS